MSQLHRSWAALRFQIIVAVIISTIIPHSLSCAAKPPSSVESTIEKVRANLLAQGSDGVAAYWAAGTGRVMGMDMTLSMRYDDVGRFVFSGRGTIPVASGFDGSTTWRQTPAGETRILQNSDALIVRLSHWLITGYWISPDAPVALGASDQKPGRGETTISITANGAPFIGTLYLDTKRWLPKRFVINDYGQDMVIHFDEWQQIGDRSVPREAHITIAGKEDGRFLLDNYHPDLEATAETYAPIDDKLVVIYNAANEGRVESMRGRWGHQFVRPRINGEDIGWVAFDTGAGMTHLYEDVARKLGLKFVGEVNSTGIGGSNDARIAIVESIEIGPVRLENVPVNVSNLNVSLGIADNKGLLAMDLLRHCVIDYDQQNSVIRLYDPSTYALPDDEWRPLLDHNGKPFVTMRFEGHDGLFTIDTGNPGGVMISPHTVNRYSLLDGRTTRSVSVGGIGGSVGAKKGNLDWVEWGHERFHDVPADFVLENRGAGADRSRDGIIGTDLLRRYRVVFDTQHGRIAYLPNSAK